jgi:hypothetical protein
MATVTKKALGSERINTNTNGNGWVQTYNFTTNASGIFVASDKATAVVQTDVVRIGILPAGVELHDCLSICSDAFSTSVTHKLGFQYVDGVDSTAVPQDDDYFYAALAATVGRTAANNTGVRPVALPKDAYLILTVNGSSADHASAGIYDFLISGRYIGVN